MTPGFAQDRFELIRSLGSGGFGDVYAARDRSTGGTVALKVLRHTGPSELLRFKREFRRVAQIVHRNLVRLYELIQHENAWFFTMELIVGRHLIEHVRTAPGPRDETVRRTFTQVVEALQALHTAGIAHRDVKPANVMVTGEGRVVLLDFGVAKEMAATARLSTVVGTPSYLAPERMRGVQDHESADWYSVGVMLYEALTGRLPFTGEWVDIVRAKQERDPEAPASVCADVPDDLNALSMALLDREPGRRPTAADIIRALTTDRALAGAGRARSERPPFVGRSAELEMLWRALEDVLRGRPAAVHVTGASGIGKTTLVRRFLDEARESSSATAILTGSCHQQETVPFNALDEFVDRLADHLSTLLPSELSFLRPPRSDLIGRIFPVFRDPAVAATSSQPEPAVADPIEVRRRAFAALKALLARLCERAPVIVALDDVQWADRDSALFLDDLFRGPEAPPLLLILGYRCDDRADHSVVDGLRTGHAHELAGQFSVVELRDLSAGDAEALVRVLLERQRIGATNDDVRRIATEAEGSPFFIHRLVQQALRTPERIGDVRSHTVIGDALAAFTVLHRRIIELIAVAGRPLPADVCVHAATRETTGAADVGQLFAGRILRLHRRGSEDFLDIYHDRIRAYVLESLPPDAIVARHDALVESFVAVRPDDADSLVHHCEGAGRAAEAARYAVAAARDASRTLAFERAAALFHRALHLGAWSRAERRSISIDLARALANTGRGRESAELFLEAAGTGTHVDDIRLRIGAADQYLRAGHLIEGERLLKQALDQVGLWVSDRPLGMLAAIVFHRARAARLLKRIDRVQPTTTTDEWHTAQLEVLWAAAVGLSMFDPVRSAEFSARHLYRALSCGDVYRIALALAGEATQLAHRDGGRDGRPRALLELALRFAVRSGEPHAIAFHHCMAGIAAFLGGRWAECIAESERAVALFRDHCTGVSWDTVTAATFLCAAHVFRGELAAQARLLPTFVADASARGDLYAAEVMPALTLSWVTDLVADDPAAAATHLPALPPSHRPAAWRVQDVNAIAGHVDVLLYEGQPERAWAIVEAYWPSLSTAIIMRVITLKTLLTATRMRSAIALAACTTSDARRRDWLLSQAERDADAIARLKSGWAEALARAGRAGVMSVRERTRDALVTLDVAAGDLFASELLPWHYAARWHLARHRAGDGAASPTLDSWWSEQRVVKPERIADLLVPGFLRSSARQAV